MSIQDIAFSILAASAMFAQGLTLDLAQLAATLRRPRTLLLGVAANLLLVPILTLLILQFVNLPVALAAAILLCSAIPGGNSGVQLSAIARGDIALSSALQSLLALGIVLVPLWLTLGLPQAAGGSEVVVKTTLITVLTWQSLPLLLGVILRRARPIWAAKIYPLAKNFSTFLLITLVSYVFWNNGQQILRFGVYGLLAPSALLFLCLAVVQWIPASPSERIALRLVSVNRNLSPTFLLASTLLHDNQVFIGVLAYGLVMYVFCAIYIGAIQLKPHFVKIKPEQITNHL